MEKFELPREFTMIQTLLGLGRRDRPLRSASRQFSFFGAEEKEKKSRAQPQLASSRPFSHGSKVPNTRGDWGCSMKLI
jgi:hypothetical protein